MSSRRRPVPVRHGAACAIAALCAPVLPAQSDPASDQAPAQEIITEQHVREVVSFLASDELRGRDSPSPGLEAAAKFVQQRLQAAGLQPGVGGGWLQHYTLPGQRLDSRGLEVEVSVVRDDGTAEQNCTLHGDADVRLLRPAAVATGTDARADVVRSDDVRLDRQLRMGGGRRATLLEVPDDHPLWLASEGVREQCSRRLRGSSPVFLVRQGQLPVTGAVPAQVGATAARTWTVTWKGAAGESVDVDLANVVGVLPGASRPDEYVVVSAHYDHLGVGAPKEGDAIYNGADDDASGTTAVVLLAESLAQGERPQRSIAFVCFSAEEKGLRGSGAFAAKPPFPLDAVVANLNIEMIGRPLPGNERAAWITGAGYSDFAAIAAPALQRAGVALVEFEPATMLFAQSDNLSLARFGVVAHSISAGSLHSDYHQPSDEVDRLDLPHMTAVIRGLEQVVREFADRSERPAYNDTGKRFLQTLRRR